MSELHAERMPTFFIPHGGGPCFFMDWPPPMTHAWDSLAAFLRGLMGSLERKPRAIAVVSAHWETPVPSVTAGSRPPLIFDYSGFPPHTYQLKYPAPGSPELAARVRELLEAAGIPSAADSERGFDHGVFIPFLLIEPAADVPIVEMSLAANLDPKLHLEIGRALAPLRDEGVLIVGSGMSYHNLATLRTGRDAGDSERFDAWLTESVEADSDTRRKRLEAWSSAPDARRAHPEEEHLLPLMVAAGAAGNDPGKRVFHDRVGAALSGYRFG
jgi:aromatic ring-opening dioxygenase catalytic subunit (LigB family)